MIVKTVIAPKNLCSKTYAGQPHLEFHQIFYQYYHNRPAVQAAYADPFQCNSTNRQNPTLSKISIINRPGVARAVL